MGWKSGIRVVRGIGDFLPMRQSLFSFSGAETFCLSHGLRQLTCDVNSDVRIINFRSDVTYLIPQKTLNNVKYHK